MESDASPPGHGGALGRWWGHAPQPSPSTDVMNQLCRVCGEPAAGFHFGAFTCEGCKSFFGRTYNNLGSITECKNNGECVINKKNRTACKACRLRKCLLVGMSKSGSRYGRRSNWFKIHCLLQEQQQAVGGNHKEKSALALWGESYKNISSSHFDSDSKESPTEEGVPLNNNVTKDRECSPGLTPVPPTYSAEAAAALWAARSSFLPMQMPHHHLPLPFLPSHFGFHPPNHPQRNFLLPFMQGMPSPSHPNPPPLTISSSPSSHASSCSETPSPTPHPLDRHSPEIKPLPKPPPNQKVAEEHSLALLRALGPVQDQPMDLSTKIQEGKHRRKNRASRHVEEDASSENSEDEKMDETENVESNDENFNRRKKPLDLTKQPQLN